MVDTLEGLGTIEGAAAVPRPAHLETLDRVAWGLYVLIFAVLPLLVVFFRSDMTAWHYAIAGLTFLGGALAICVINVLE